MTFSSWVLHTEESISMSGWMQNDSGMQRANIESTAASSAAARVRYPVPDSPQSPYPHSQQQQQQSHLGLARLEPDTVLTDAHTMQHAHMPSTRSHNRAPSEDQSQQQPNQQQQQQQQQQQAAPLHGQRSVAFLNRSGRRANADDRDGRSGMPLPVPEPSPEPVMRSARRANDDARDSRAGNSGLGDPMRRSSVDFAQARRTSGDQVAMRRSGAGARAKVGRAHVHIIGEISSASGFAKRCLFCTWELVHDQRLWTVAGGLDKGRTHVSSPHLPEEGTTVWEHPIDLWLTTHSIQRWPSILIKVYHRSVWIGRDEFVAYGLVSLPTAPGLHHISCPTWHACEARRTFGQAMQGMFDGLAPQLVDEAFVTDLDKRFEMGQHLHSQGAGSVQLRLQLVVKDLQDLTHVGGESVHRSLERLHSSVDKMKRRAASHSAAFNDRDEESEGLRLVREGRDARMAAAQAVVAADGQLQLQRRDQGWRVQDSEWSGSAGGGSPARRVGGGRTLGGGSEYGGEASPMQGRTPRTPLGGGTPRAGEGCTPGAGGRSGDTGGRSGDGGTPRAGGRGGDGGSYSRTGGGASHADAATAPGSPGYGRNSRTAVARGQDLEADADGSASRYGGYGRDGSRVAAGGRALPRLQGFAESPSRGSPDSAASGEEVQRRGLLAGRMDGGSDRYSSPGARSYGGHAGDPSESPRNASAMDRLRARGQL